MSALSLEGRGGIAAMRTRMAASRKALTATEQLYRRLQRRLSRWLTDNFQSQGALLEGAAGHWPPLAQATLAARRRRGRGVAPLEDSGRLRRGMFAREEAGGVRLGNAVPYAAAHQLGQGVPRRAFLPGPAQTGRLAYPELERFVREAQR